VVASFNVNADGSLEPVSRTNSGGAPVSLAIYNGTEIVTADYDTGIVTSFPIGEDGVTLGDATPSFTLVGSGPNSSRQAGPHPHNLVQHGNEVLISDLGSDKVWRIVKSDSGAWQLAGSIDQVPGSGPRHIVATDDKVYVLHELDNSLVLYTLPPLEPTSAKTRMLRRCTPSVLGNITIVPSDGPSGAVWAAGELLMSPDGKYLYASNRNTGTTDSRGDPIAIVSVDSFKVIDEVYTKLDVVRGMELGGTNGEYLIAAGQTSGGVAIYQRNATDGSLKELDRYSDDGSSQLSTFAWVKN